MKQVFYLETCSTCQKIMNDLQLDNFEKREIKSQPISAEEIDQMKTLAGSFEALFSRRAMKFRQWGLHEQELTEQDYRNYILKEYTFLKRPVFILDDEIFIGNSKKTIESLAKRLKK